MQRARFSVFPAVRTSYSVSTTSLNWALLKKPPVAQLLHNFQTCYGNWNSFEETLHSFLSWARIIQSIPPNPISLRYCHVLWICVNNINGFLTGWSDLLTPFRIALNRNKVQHLKVNDGLRLSLFLFSSFSCLSSQFPCNSTELKTEPNCQLQNSTLSYPLCTDPTENSLYCWQKPVYRAVA